MQPSLLRRLFDPRFGSPNHFVARWLFLRALGLIYFSAFFSLLFQIRGLIGPHGILPAGPYLAAVARALPHARYWFAPTLLWVASGDRALMALTWAGLLASLLVVFNLWPRISLAVCFVCFLSFIAAAQDFASYQSDGMLLAAGFLALFIAPGGRLPGWGRRSLPTRAGIFLLLWECFRIYFESGAVKLLSGDPTWRNLTAMDEYYQNGPLPTWVGWHLQHLPHPVHAATAALTLLLELVLVWTFWLPRRWRIACFLVITPWQAVVILTANYCFLNYLVLALGVFLLDDAFLLPRLPRRLRFRLNGAQHATEDPETWVPAPTRWANLRFVFNAVVLSSIGYATTLQMLQMFAPRVPLPTAPVAALEPFRISNQYGLFATMTPHRYEIEFQGSDDGQTWTPYPFLYKPQDVHTAPGIYAPYQPRFDWNLWFCSLTVWQGCPIVPRTEELLLTRDPAVLELFAGNPFPAAPPRYVRAVLFQYWFTSLPERHQHGLWWRRQLLGTYAPAIEQTPTGPVLVGEPAVGAIGGDSPSP